MAVCTLNLDDLSLEFSGAKTPLLLLKDGELMVIKGDKSPIGGHYKQSSTFKNHCLQLAKGDQFFLYTDGFQDQFGGEHGKKVMAAPFRKVLFRVAQNPINEQLNLLTKILNNWVGSSYRQIDDILVIGIKI